MLLLVLFNHLFLFQAFNGDDPTVLLLPTESHFSESTLPDDTDRLKIPFAYLFSLLAQILHFLLEDMSLGIFSFLNGEVELLHFFLKYFPILRALVVSYFVEIIFFFDIFFDFFRLMSGGLADD